MKFIIEHGSVKREIDGPFNICASRKDIQYLIDTLSERLTEEFYYGWIEIPIHIEQPSIANTQPLPWDLRG